MESLRIERVLPAKSIFCAKGGQSGGSKRQSRLQDVSHTFTRRASSPIRTTCILLLRERRTVTPEELLLADPSFRSTPPIQLQFFT